MKTVESGNESWPALDSPSLDRGQLISLVDIRIVLIIFLDTHFFVVRFLPDGWDERIELVGFLDEFLGASLFIAVLFTLGSKNIEFLVGPGVE